ncbi:DUF6361 family protein [Neorhizobium tomejilense]|uniref:DUF6361 family protein n=1 Tax=Neorhizobium tomejilense TaxID=2093828 RepID=UPI003ED0FF46
MSSLAWTDFDEAERQPAQRIMALFQERETRDERSLGAIKVSIADHLFLNYTLKIVPNGGPRGIF